MSVPPAVVVLKGWVPSVIVGAEVQTSSPPGPPDTMQEPSSMMVDPAADAVGGDAAGGGMKSGGSGAGSKAPATVEGKKEAAEDSDEDMGEPLGSPQTFEPTDVAIGGNAMPVS